MKKTIILLTLILSCVNIFAISPKERRSVSNHLQDISVTIRSEGKHSNSEGSGVLITRQINGEKITFVWTCAHVVDNLRRIRTVIRSGTSNKIVEFDDVKIIKEIVEEGRRVGEIKMDASVIKYSDAEDGEDLALLMVRAKDYGKASAKFYLSKEEPIIPIGTPLFHVGSLLGQFGSNSMTSGIVSQVGRIRDKTEYDQTTVTAFPGSSGGGVFLEDGRYVGMIVRGAGEGFNLMVPVRRIKRWAEAHGVMWAIDPSVKIPPLTEIKDLPVENTSNDDEDKDEKKGNTDFPKEFDTLPFLIKINKN
tara:strand:- start:591 stop:1508 length:918 start_codon:yes stop_codon:yes gene_type:complete